MMVSWNISGLNKPGKIIDISPLLINLRLVILVLLETRVKKHNAQVIRNKLKVHDTFIDNYEKHDNGRIWISWDDRRVDMTIKVFMTITVKSTK